MLGAALAFLRSTAAAFGAVDLGLISPDGITPESHRPHFGADGLRLDSPLARRFKLRFKNC